ncbi:MAG TPA: YeeE/YedE family protein [Methylophilaceae bacterium]|nr:YeeE/YedE family protein [Methylophilaceae bacterium]
MIDWHNFTPWPAFTGGLLIGLAAAVLILFNGRIAGVSGILLKLIKLTWPQREEWLWRLLFIAGLVISPLIFRLFAPLPAAQADAGIWLLAIAGVLVGLGTSYGGGCTSGHGVCGLSRLSLRSLVATLLFMASGIAAVFIVRHLLN